MERDLRMFPPLFFRVISWKRLTRWIQLLRNIEQHRYKPVTHIDILETKVITKELRVSTDITRMFHASHSNHCLEQEYYQKEKQ